MTTCQDIVRAVTTMVGDLQGCMQKEPPAATHRFGWRPPDNGYLKSNIYGVFKQETKASAWGFIIRDHVGLPIITGVGSFTLVHDALMAEKWLANRPGGG